MNLVDLQYMYSGRGHLLAAVIWVEWLVITISLILSHDSKAYHSVSQQF